MTLAPSMLAAAALAAGASLAVPAPLTIGLRGTLPPEAERGVLLGIAEASRTSKLLGRDVRLVRIDGARAVSRVDAIVSATALAADGASTVPIVYLAAPPAPRTGRCTFFIRENTGRTQLVAEWRLTHATRENAARDLAIVEWDSSLQKYGASELNDRYRARFGAPMPPDAWVGWVAVKAIAEAALRSGSGADGCSALQSVRFDGHKGTALSFDPRTGGLADPVYVVGRTNGETEILGEVRSR
jgi:hypothetical protein